MVGSAQNFFLILVAISVLFILHFASSRFSIHAFVRIESHSVSKPSPHVSASPSPPPAKSTTPPTATAPVSELISVPATAESKSNTLSPTSSPSVPSSPSGLLTASKDASKSFKAPADCANINCKNSFVPGTGFPLHGFSGFIGELVCPSMFRDFADYVLSWPFDHFEEDVYLAKMNEVGNCLAPVPIFYWQTNKNKIPELDRILRSFGREFILVTGQSDYPVPSAYNLILNNPNLVRWFGQNNDMLPVHPKFTPIPIGLNCFLHGEALERFTADEQKKEVKDEDKVFMVNFSSATASSRKPIRDQFCEGALEAFTSCLSWDGFKGVTSLSQIDTKSGVEDENFASVAKSMYVVAPRGNGESTHRTWQGLYVGTVPIVMRSSIDEALKGLPIHFVDDFSEITVDSVDDLRELYRTKYKPMFDDPEIQKRLHRGYYFNLIEEARVEALNEKGLSNVEEERVQCWGSN
mmetsp:Transcript_25742/g.53506  ORF Transcript_25742/g.53506 Transcript_25742/m.53506 type:complete len:466 (-) Transcript_25742:3331-4728(-)